MTEEFIQQCLALQPEEQKMLIARLTANVKGIDYGHAADLLDIYRDVTGRKVNLFSRDQEDVWGKAMVGYQLLQEGYTLQAVTRMLYRKDHSVIIRYRRKMEDVFAVPEAYRDIIEIWNNFKARYNDILKGRDGNPLQV